MRCIECNLENKIYKAVENVCKLYAGWGSSIEYGKNLIIQQYLKCVLLSDRRQQWKGYISYNSNYVMLWKRQHMEGKNVSVIASDLREGKEGWIVGAQGMSRVVKPFL